MNIPDPFAESCIREDKLATQYVLESNGFQGKKTTPFRLDGIHFSNWEFLRKEDGFKVTLQARMKAGSLQFRAQLLIPAGTSAKWSDKPHRREVTGWHGTLQQVMARVMNSLVTYKLEKTNDCVS